MRVLRKFYLVCNSDPQFPVEGADDDTYFFVHNFRDFIARWDPDAVHFFGNTMKYEAGTNPHTGGPSARLP